MKYHLNEMFSARQEQLTDKVGGIFDGEEDKGGEGGVVRDGEDIKGEEESVVVVRVGGGGEGGTLQDTSA